MSAPAAEQALLTHKTLVYSATRLTMAAMLRTYNRARVSGAEHLPSEGPVVLAANHQSLLDIPLIAMATRRHVSFVARKTLARSAPLAFLMRQCGAVLVERGTADRRAVGEMIAHLEAGDALAVFPEGTRALDNQVGPFLAGALLAARRAGAPIVPVGIRGTFEVWPRGARLPRPRPVRIAFGPAMGPKEPGALERLRESVGELSGLPLRPETALEAESTSGADSASQEGGRSVSSPGSEAALQKRALPDGGAR